jgi:hypothetical protein
MEGLLREHENGTAVVYLDGKNWTASIYLSGVSLAVDAGDSASHVEPNQDEAKVWALQQIGDDDAGAPWTPITFDDAPLPPLFGLWTVHGS